MQDLVLKLIKKEIQDFSRLEAQRTPIQYMEGQQLLFDSSYRAIPFNITMATLLAIYLAYNEGPKELIIIWLVTMIIVSCLRMIHCKLVISKELLKNKSNFCLEIFFVLTMLTGLIWTSIYFLLIPCVAETQLYVIILVFGGMAAGSTTTLAIYFPAFLVYILSIFLPIIIYNFSIYEFNHAMLATMFMFFLLAITIIGKAHQKLLKSIFFLKEQNSLLIDKFEMLSITDSLTGLYNRRHFTKVIQEEHNRAKRNQQSFALVSIDIDYFKLINDNFGHIFGDKFLIYTANYFKHYLQRANDIVFRLGGDEFSAILVNTTEKSTKDICEQLKEQYKKFPAFDYDLQNIEVDKILNNISLSIGVVFVPYDSSVTIEQIIEKADQVLYKSKHEGRNRISYTKCT